MVLRILFCLTLASLTACSKPEQRAARLRKLDRIYVALDPKSLSSLNQALGSSLENYGAVKSSDFVPVFQEAGFMMNGSEQYGPLVYSSQTLIPQGTWYMPMTERQLLESMTSRNIHSVCVDRDSSEQYPISEGEMKEELKALPE